MDDVVKDRKPIEALIPIERVGLYRREDAPPPLAVRDIGKDLAAISSEAAFLQMIERAARDPNVDLDKLERLMAMQERVLVRNAKTAFAAALSAMQPELPTVDRNGRIKITKKDKPEEILQSTPYALFEDINEAVRPILAALVFALSFRMGTAADGKLTVTGILSHRDGHSEETTIPLMHDSTGSKNAVQAVGSSVSYGKRYTAMALLNITSRAPHDRDDDGNKAGATPISDEQLAALREALFAIKGDDAKFCQLFKIENLSDLPASKYKEAIDTIRSVGAKKANKGDAR